jgi:CubicO group peptidase (beta-lactamase class C family)
MKDKLGAIGDYVQEAMASWQIPGVALAVLHGDDVLHMAGYGVRDVEEGLPVTPETRFAIASMTKAFTAMGVALLVDEGKVKWDTPVREYFPAFKLKDDYASDHITLRDMLSHRSGLPRHDLAWYGSTATREQIVHSVRYHEPNKTFREGWEYQNAMYVTAGYITGLVAGTTWEEFIQARIFDCLGMSGSSLYLADMLKGEHSMPYRIRREKGQPNRVEKMPFYDNPVMGPAGNIFSNLTDLAKWLTVHLNDGRYGDIQLVSPGNLAEMHKPQMIMPVDGLGEKLRGTTIAAYGMGWFVEPYKGYTLVQHGGNIDGFSLNIAFVPQEKIGVVILTNIDGKPLRDSLTYEVVDRLLGLPDNDWNGKYHAIWAEFEKAQDQERETTDTERVPNAPPTHPLSDYEGEYVADGYADFRVTVDGDRLAGFLIGNWWPLNHYHYDVFELDLDRFELRMKITFQTDTRGNIVSASIPIEPTVKEIVFTRKPVVLGGDLLQSLAGVYDFPLDGVYLTVTHKPDGKLFAQLTGQPEIELIPYQATDGGAEFNLKDQPNTRLEFAREDGKLVAVIKQFGGVYRAPRVEG